MARAFEPNCVALYDYVIGRSLLLPSKTRDILS